MDHRRYSKATDASSSDLPTIPLSTRYVILVALAVAKTIVDSHRIRLRIYTIATFAQLKPLELSSRSGSLGARGLWKRSPLLLHRLTIQGVPDQPRARSPRPPPRMSIIPCRRADKRGHRFSIFDTGAFFQRPIQFPPARDAAKFARDET